MLAPALVLVALVFLAGVSGETGLLGAVGLAVVSVAWLVVDKPVEGPLSGQTFVITGTLESFTRDEAAQALEAKGAKVSNSVSKKTAGLIVGEEPGSKLKKAQDAGVPVLDEKALQKLLSG